MAVAVADASARSRADGHPPDVRYETVFDIVLDTPREVRHRFIDRRSELASLERTWASPDAQLVVLYGRRRVGKSALLTRFAADRSIVYYVGARQLKRDQLTDIGGALGRLAVGFRRGRPPRLSLADWDDMLAAVADGAQNGRVGLILDEFPYLVESDPALPSLIQRWWDRTGSRSNLMLVLAGSHQSMMQRLVASDGALHGRPTLTLPMRALDYLQAAKFVPGWSPDDRIRTFAVAGGVPAYLQHFDDQREFRDEVLRLAYSADGRLFSEAPSLLQTEFQEPRTYESILRAIAGGEALPSRIAQHAGLSGANVVGPYLDRLIELGIVVRVTLPPDIENPRPRTSRYVIADHYLRFYFRLVDPFRSDIQVGRGDEVLAGLWPEAFDLFVSGAFEDVVRTYLRLRPPPGRPLTHIGPWWFDAGDIDAAGLAGPNLTVAAEARWSRGYLKPADLDELRANVSRVAPGSRPELLLVSRGGFDPNLRRSDATLVTLTDLFRRELDPESRVRISPSPGASSIPALRRRGSTSRKASAT
jgi:AAA+ ATPase superfamily predicted ATPase